MHKSGWWIGALMLPLAACSNSDSAAETPAGKSGLSSTLVLSAASDAQKLQFCNWLVSVAPSNACTAASASSADGGAPVDTDGGAVVAPDGGASTATAQCLASFSGFTNGCAVLAAEQCFSAWEASGSCEVPVRAGCAAYDACAKAAPPKNGQSGWAQWTCYDAAKAFRGYVQVDKCPSIDWTLFDYTPCDGMDVVHKACNDKFPACNGGCKGVSETG